MQATWHPPSIDNAAQRARRSRPQSLSLLTPKGSIEPTGATLHILMVLASQPQRFWSHQEILAQQSEPKSLSWSLRYAQVMGWVRSTQDERSQRYLRYQITALGMKAFKK